MMVFVWFILSAIVGVLASGKNRSFLGYFLGSLILSPLLMLLILLVVGTKP